MTPDRAKSLYWVTTKDHDEDWFILGSSRTKAEKFFENAEGYDPDTARATFLQDLPENRYFEEGYASYDLIRKLGYKRSTKNGLSVYRKNGKTFLQGSVAYRVFLRSVDHVSGVYVIPRVSG